MKWIPLLVHSGSPSVMITLYVLPSIDFRFPLSWHHQITNHRGTRLLIVPSVCFVNDADSCKFNWNSQNNAVCLEYYNGFYSSSMYYCGFIQQIELLLSSENEHTTVIRYSFLCESNFLIIMYPDDYLLIIPNRIGRILIKKTNHYLSYGMYAIHCISY